MMGKLRRAPGDRKNDGGVDAGRRNLVLGLGGAVLLGGLMLLGDRCCDREQPASPAPAPSAATCPPPAQECLPFAKNFDTKCGYCGDGVKQANETTDNCLVDTHCGDGKLQKNVSVGAYMRNEDGTYSLVSRTINECDTSSTDHCAAECRTVRRSRRGRSREARPTAASLPPSSDACGDLLRSSEKMRIGRWIQSAGNRSIDTLRGQLGGANVKMTLSSQVEVDSDGSVRYLSGKVSGGGSSASVSGSTLSVSGFTIAPPGKRCRATITNTFGSDSSQ